MTARPAAFSLVRQCCLVGAATVLCASTARGEAWLIVPRVDVSETYSSNVTLISESPVRGWISDISPGIRIVGGGARLKANLDYQLDSLYYSGSPSIRQNLNSLTSSATLEAVDKWLYIDANASIGQRNASAFAPVATDNRSALANRAETRTVAVSPYVKGSVADLVAYQLREISTASRSDDAALANTYVTQWIGSLKNNSAGAKIGWFVDGDFINVRNDILGSRDDNRLRAGVTIEVLPQFNLLVSDGTEQANFDTATKKSGSTPGIGLQWAPSPRTQLAALAERRFFGSSHSFLLSHRTALLNWRYSDIKDVTNLSSLLATSGESTIAVLMSDLLAASIPDPAARAEAVRARLEQSAVTTADLTSGAVQTSRLFINRVRDASVVWLAPRDTVELILIQRDQEALDNSTSATDSFAQSNLIRERSATVSWTHRLTPSATLNFLTTRFRTDGLSVANLTKNQLTQALSITFMVAPKTLVSVGARGTRFDSSINGSFRENAVVATLSQRF
ncbi:uncharacterized protein (PEP-CTERM system associated) [Actimicrobium sp. GrIS 1.19]|uniref:TIGR03016 family PEP-CTERM system-associated outer membrane protein n=1 Tax=Actimicrobium sp. GrIS 1.19 TaxID=3071708 RepID=UPI002E08CD3E|nr:uncharacterized protein (PEP-CTERM system associated) [Actimicrobium sp. GrIS 1.19]